MLKEGLIYETRPNSQAPIAIPIKITKEIYARLENREVMNISLVKTKDLQPTLKIDNEEFRIRVSQEEKRLECYATNGGSNLTQIGKINEHYVLIKEVGKADRAKLKQLATDSEDRKNQKKAVLIDIPEHSKDTKKTINRKPPTVDLQLRRTLVHYLAAQPRLISECMKKTRKSKQIVLAALKLIAKPQSSNKDRYQMSNEEFDPHKFTGYTESEKQSAIKNANLAFNALNLKPDAPERLRMLPLKKIDNRRESVIVDRKDALSGENLNQTNGLVSPTKLANRPIPNGVLSTITTDLSTSNRKISPISDSKALVGSNSLKASPLVKVHETSPKTQKNIALKIVGAGLEERKILTPSPLRSPVGTTNNEKPVQQKKFVIQSRPLSKKPQNIYQNGSNSIENTRKIVNTDKSEEEYSSSQESLKRLSNGTSADSKRQRIDPKKDNRSKRKAHENLEEENEKHKKPKDESPKLAELQSKKVAPTIVYRPPKLCSKRESFDLDALCEVKQETIDDVRRNTEKPKLQETPKQEEKMQEYVPRVALGIYGFNIDCTQWQKMDAQNMERYCSWMHTRKLKLDRMIKDFQIKLISLKKTFQDKKVEEFERNLIIKKDFGGDLGGYILKMKRYIREHSELCEECNDFEEWVRCNGGTVKIH